LDLYGNVKSDMMIDIEDYGLTQAQLALHEKHDEYIDAARVCLAEGNLIDALRTYLKDSKLESYVEASECLLSGLWRLLPLWSTPTGSEMECNMAEIVDLLMLDARFDRLARRERHQVRHTPCIYAEHLTANLMILSYKCSAPY
jgi:hypothetical protein